MAGQVSVCPTSNTSQKNQGLRVPALVACRPRPTQVLEASRGTPSGGVLSACLS